MLSEIAQLEADILATKEQLANADADLKDHPENQALAGLKSSLEEAIELYTATLEEIKALAPPPAADQVEPAAAAVHSRESGPPKWSKADHPAFQNKKEQRAPSPEAPIVFKTGDMVLARWISGDKGFHPARITAVTGSTANPFYNVKFKEGGDTESNLRKEGIKPLRHEANKKRKADSQLVPPPPPPPPSATSGTSGVISARPDIDLSLAADKKEPSKVGDGPARPAKIPRKIKDNGTLRQTQASWKAFSEKGPKGAKGHTKKKESMFRLGEGPDARVGFVGSGQAMRKEGPRTKYVHGKLDEE